MTRAVRGAAVREPAGAGRERRGGGTGRAAEVRLLRWQRGAGNRAVQRLLARRAVPVQRRVPDATHADPLLDAHAADGAAHVRGMRRLVDRVMAELDDEGRSEALGQAHQAAGGKQQYDQLGPRDQLRHLAAVLRRYDDDFSLVLGDPALIETRPRHGTGDLKNLDVLIARAAALIADVLADSQNKSLAQVFGSTNVYAAKMNYQAALTRMHELRSKNQIVVDRSGYSREVGVTGQSNPDRIQLAAKCLDHPADDESAVALVHEALHAGNAAIKDYGYIDSTGFTTLAASVKLANAAHYEVVPRRIRKLANSFPDRVFAPAGTTVVLGEVTHAAPKPTELEQACREASETYRQAWQVGLWVHYALVQVNLHPAEWVSPDLTGDPRYPGAKGRLADCLPYWSKVEGLTIHERPKLHQESKAPSRAPVTQVDVALSEELQRSLAAVLTQAGKHLDTDQHAQSLLAAHTTAQERSAAKGLPAWTELLIRTLRRTAGELTGDESRDLLVVRTMAAAVAPGGGYSRVLVPLDPATFP